MKAKKELIIAKKAKQKLNRQQQTFNRLVRKLEKLRKDKEKTEKFLSENLDYYGKHIHQLEEKSADLAAEAAKTFYRLFREKSTLKKADKEILIEIICGQMNDFLENSKSEPDAELKEIFEFIDGESFEEAKEADFQAMKEDMEQTFKEMGFDIDLDDFTSDLSEDELMRKMFEKVGDVKEQIEAEVEAKEEADKKRKKTKRQIEKEEREKQVEEAKNKNISAIYKQLAKVFHPDLERDEKRRDEKEVLMKQLTSAYKQGDLHTLLKLELEWLQKEEDNLENLSDEKLKIYNQALKEQVEELEMQIQLAVQHPRYLPLHRYFNFFGIHSINLKKEQEKMETINKLTENDLKELNGKSPMKRLREIIRQTRKDIKNQQMFEIGFGDFLDRF